MIKVKSNLRIFVVCIVTAFVCLFGYIMLQSLCTELFIRWGLEERTSFDMFGNGFWWTIFIFAILVPIVEEIIFRWLSCRLLVLTKMPRWCVIIISAILFAVYHGSWSQLVYQFLMGIWLAWIFLKTNQIGWTVLVHIINNAFVITYTYFAGNSNDVFNLSTGNIILTVGLAVVTTVAVFFLLKKGIPNYEK